MSRFLRWRARLAAPAASRLPRSASARGLVTGFASARVTASLAVAVAAFALPSAAGAATVDLDDSGKLTYRGGAGEINSLNVTMFGPAVEIKDFAGLTSRTGLCASVTPATVRCAIGVVRFVDAKLGDRNDSTSIRFSIPTVVDGGAGDDIFGPARGSAPTTVNYIGGSGFDRADYRGATRGVRVSTNGIPGDGRPGFDADNIQRDVERLIGSDFGDELIDGGGVNVSTQLNGGLGDGHPARGGEPARDGLRHGPGGRRRRPDLRQHRLLHRRLREADASRHGDAESRRGRR